MMGMFGNKSVKNISEDIAVSLTCSRNILEIIEIFSNIQREISLNVLFWKRMLQIELSDSI